MAMNLVFSFDSILSAIALTDNKVVMATAIVISGVLMIVLADTVADFKKNRMYEVLAFILFIVGVMLVSEGDTSPLVVLRVRWSRCQVHLLLRHLDPRRRGHRPGSPEEARPRGPGPG